MKTKKFLSFALVLTRLAGMLPGMSLTASAAGNTTEITPTNTSGTMTITLTIKAAQTITASDVTATYGDTDKSVTASVTTPATGGGAISYTVKDGSGDYIDVASDGKLTIKKVPASGKAYVIVKAAETDDYAETTKEVTVTISKAEATVAAKDQGIMVGGTVPDLSAPVLNTHYSVTGLVGTDALTTAPTLAYQKNGSAATPDNTTAGTYNIVPSGASAGDNYNISYTNGTLTITAKDTQNITASDVTATYGDTNKSVSATTDGNGTISYAVKSGSENYIDVNASTGALTIKAVPADGKAYVTVTASETNTGGTGGKGYAAATKDVTVTISKADPTATAPTATATYGQTLASVTLTNPTGNTPGTWAWVDDGTTSVGNAGSNTFKANFTPADATNYNSKTNVDVTVTVNKANPGTPTVTMSGYTYGGTVSTPSIGTYSGDGAVTYYYSTTNSASGGTEWKNITATTLNANTYYMYAEIAETGNYNGYTTATQSFTVSKGNQAAPAAPTKASATINSVTLTAVTGCEYSKDGETWQDSPEFTGLEMNKEYTFYQRLKETTNYNASPSSSAIIKTNDHAHAWNYAAGTGENANTITATCANTDDGHTGSLTATLTIVAPTLTVYGSTGDAAATITGSIDGVDNPAIVYKQGSAMLDTAPTDAGDYRAEITLGSGENAATAYVTYTIGKAALTVTAKPKTITYGDASSNDGVEYSGFVNGETEAVLGGTLAYDYSYAQYGDVGNAYTITPKGLTSDNYAITFASGTLTVVQKEVGLSWGESSFTYDGTAHAPTATATGLVNSDEIGVTVTGEQTAASATAYTATASALTGDKAGNYKLPEANTQSFTIGKTALTVTAKPKTITYGDASANDGVEYSGFVNGETEAVLGGTLAYDYSYAQYGDVGNAYTITPKGLTSDNYAITFASGTLTVVQKEVGLSWGESSFTYDGTAHAPTATATGLVNSDEIGVTVTGEQTAASATAYTATASALTGDKAGNYKLPEANTQSFTIGKTAISGAIVSMEAYAYDDTISAPVIVSDGKEGSNGALVGSDTTKQVTYYYQATAFLKSQTDDISKLENTEGVYKTLTPTTFDAGTHYVLAVITGDNYSNVPYITQSAFEVKQNTEKERTAPTAPAVDGTTVTVAEADRGKTLEYSLDGETWMPVTLGENGQFTAAWSNAVENATLLLRETANENYAKPSASAQGSQTITTTTFTVTYDANGGVNAPAAVTVTKDRTVTVSGQRSMTHAGYSFTGWNTAADGSGTPYAAGSTVNTGLTLYAQWQANTYTVRFYANGGTGTMETQSFTYDAAQALTENAFVRADYTFLGWSKSSSGGVQYQDKQTVKNLAESGTVTLYAVWAKDVYNITGAVKSAETGKIDIELVQGSNSFGSTEVTYDTADVEAPFTLNGVPAGTYNLIATQGDKTMTVAVIITDGNVALDTITMPTGDTSSVLEVSGSETPPIVVSGLDTLAQDEEIDERSVTVTMTVEAQDAGETAEAAEAIEKAATSGSSIVYLDIKITKEIYNEGTLESTETITETGNILEFVIPYDFTGKSTVKVYRYHDGVAKALTEASTGAEGTYRLDRTNGLIYVYASNFSTYAIGYTTPSYYGGGGGGETTYTPTITETEHGTVSVAPKSAASGTKVTVTVKPDEGYELDTIKATDANGKEVTLTKNEDGTYTYTQPSSKVTITATFKAIEKPAQPFFVDVPEDSYYYDAVKWAVENEITQGTSDTTFSPSASCTRAQMVTFLWRAAGKPEPTSTTTAFTDIDASAYYYKAVLWAFENGITLGTSDTTFSPDATVTRSQSVTFLFRALSGAAGTENPFKDVQDGAFYYDAVKWAVENGITQGTSSTTFSPDDDCLRAQIVTFLYRAYNKA